MDTVEFPIRQPIPMEKFAPQSVSLWEPENLLLSAGDFATGKFNAMTVGWGSFGVMWNRPIAMVVVRPVRYTYEFMEQYNTFTLSAFPGRFASALKVMGNRSGRDGDKIAAARLHPTASTRVAAPSFQEADLIVECNKIYSTDFKSEDFFRPLH